MKAVTLLAVAFAFFKCINAGPFSSCKIEGISDTEMFFGYRAKNPINDDHDGVVMTLKTSNIERLELKETIYLNATFENENISIFTNERFKNFEKEAKENRISTIEILFYIYCTGGGSEVLRIYQKVNDVNNHDPVLNQNRYEYDFAMTVPEEFDMTVFQTISATDDDFSNSKITYNVEESDKLKGILRLGTEKTVYPDYNTYLTSLTALKNITAPFEQEFTIIATDGGDPTRSTKATVVVRVTLFKENETSQEGAEKPVHPPVFSQHLYFANYTTNHELKMEKPIVISHGPKENMIIRQSDYQEYFKISQASTIDQLEVEVIKPLTDKILAKKQIVIEIEAENEGLSIPGRTALVINLPENETTEGSSEEKPENDVHPPVFSKHLYFATYTSKHGLEMKETITLKFGATDNMIVRQSGYKEYFEVTQKTTKQLQVKTIKPLPESFLEKDLLTVEIEAENPGLSIPARTALLIGPVKNGEKDCDFMEMWGFNYGANVFPVILFLAAIVVIVFVNILVLSLYFYKRRENSISANEQRPNIGA